MGYVLACYRVLALEELPPRPDALMKAWPTVSPMDVIPKTEQRHSHCPSADIINILTHNLSFPVWDVAFFLRIPPCRSDKTEGWLCKQHDCSCPLRSRASIFVSFSPSHVLLSLLQPPQVVPFLLPLTFVLLSGLIFYFSFLSSNSILAPPTSLPSRSAASTLSSSPPRSAAPY